MIALRYIVSCFFFIGLGLNGSVAYAGAWTLDPKERQSISTVIIDRADRVFGPDVDADVNPNFNKFETALYIDCLLYTSPSPRD